MKKAKHKTKDLILSIITKKNRVLVDKNGFVHIHKGNYRGSQRIQERILYEDFEVEHA